MFVVSNLIAIKVAAGGFVNYDKNTCDGLSACQKTISRFQIRLRDMIHNSISLTLMEN